MHRQTYAVWWNEDGGPRRAGRLEVGRLQALFSGNGNGRLALPLDQVTSVEYARGEVVIHRRDAADVRIGSLDAPGALRECAMRLASAA